MAQIIEFFLRGKLDKINPLYSIEEIYRQCSHVNSGKMADYIPQLEKQNPDHFGLSICTVDGQRLNMGDSDVEFCVQSCSKPISYCIALDEHG